MTKRKIEQKLNDLKDKHSTKNKPAYSVEWRNGDPEHRPDGIETDHTTGTIYYDYWDAQKKCLQKLQQQSNDIVGFLGGYASGKTILGARWSIQMALEYPGSKFLAMGQDFTKGRESTFEKLFTQLPGERTHITNSRYNGPEQSPIVANYDRSLRRIRLTNDSAIVLGSADSWDRYAGTGFGAIWLDEPSHYGNLYGLLEMLDGRLRGTAGPKLQLWTLTGNGYNDAWEIIEKRENQDGDPLGHQIDIVRASSLDNPYLDEGEKQRFKRKYGNSDRGKQALYGKFAAAQGLVYKNFEPETHIIPHSEATDLIDPKWRIYGYDVGWSSPTVLLEIGKSSYDQLVVIDEFYETEAHVSDVIEWLRTNSKPVRTIFADHEPKDIAEFNQSKFQAEKADKSLDSGIADVHHLLKSDNEDRVGLLISDNCRNLIREFLNYQEDEVGSNSAVDHALDALRYAITTSGSGRGRTQQPTRQSKPLREPIVRGVKGGIFSR